MNTASEVFVTPLSPAQPLTLPNPLRRAAGILGDLLALAGVIVGIPVVILAIGIPIALCVRLLLWLVGMLL
jgi:hypothetical protein